MAKAKINAEHFGKMLGYGKCVNPSEANFRKYCQFNKICYTRRGYPDFMILEDDEIVAFVEVKPEKKEKLRKGQEMFRRFCEKHGIPFMRWSPDSSFESVKDFLALRARSMVSPPRSGEV